MDIELRHFRYFLALAEELHFGRAASRLGIAQPALSQGIKRLESALGAELFVRTKRQVALSEAGVAMVEPAGRALAEADAAVETARRAARGEIGQLAVGFLETAAGTILPGSVRSFRSAHPNVHLSLRELPVGAQLDGLRNGQLDVAIVRPPIDAQHLQVLEVLEEGLVVAVPSDHPLCSRSHLGPCDLNGESLVLLSKEVVPGLHEQIVGLGSLRDAASVAQTASSIQAVLGLVAGGLGVSLLPSSVRSLDRRGVVLIDLSPSPRTAMLIARRSNDRSALTAAFIAEALAASGRDPAT